MASHLSFSRNQDAEGGWGDRHRDLDSFSASGDDRQSALDYEILKWLTYCILREKSDGLICAGPAWVEAIDLVHNFGRS
jgi:hypothetical protein